MSVITTILATDIVGDSRAVINTNFTNLNSGKYEAWTVSSVGVSTALSAINTILLVDATTGTRTVTLPTAIGNSGLNYVIKDSKGQSSSRNITIATVLSQTIDGVTTKVLNSNYNSVQIISDGANWNII